MIQRRLIRLALSVLLLGASLMLSGCGAILPAQCRGKLITNPLVEAELDSVFLEELSAMVKLNDTILERMPVSLDDRWPEMLDDYSKKVGYSEQHARHQYNACLTRHLKNDFSFFKIYNPANYAQYLTKKAGLCGFIMSIRAAMFIAAAEAMGRNYEHAKEVLGYVPFGCTCAYYNPAIASYRPGGRVCRDVVKKAQCAYFNAPTEDLLQRYAFGGEGGMYSWVDLRIDDSCFRVVGGTRVGATFKDAFYTLLPASSRDMMRDVDEEVAQDEADLSNVKAQKKSKGIGDAEKFVLDKREEQLSKALNNQKQLQKKLYKQAMTTIEDLSPEKVRTAKRLLLIADYIDANFAEISTAMLALTAKIVDDVSTWRRVKPRDWNVMLNDMVSMGVARGGPRARANINKRFTLMARRLVMLPVTYFDVWGYAIAQKAQVEKYKNYLNAVIAQENKIKKECPADRIAAGAK